MTRRWMLVLGALWLAATMAAAAEDQDPAFRFLGHWQGPANVYEDSGVLKPTNATAKIERGTDAKYVVEVTVLGDKLTRFTQCTLKHVGEMTVREEVLVDLRKVRVKGVLRSLNGRRIEEGHIQFFVETPQGDYRPYYAIKFAAKRVPKPTEPSPAPIPKP
ncbi:MAG: hypothetical protein P9L99_12550 [Candidatus Lernaella stagnicola]|nr:hypothetical protein [Candidatus Lernaella stagnicola]